MCMSRKVNNSEMGVLFALVYGCGNGSEFS